MANTDTVTIGCKLPNGLLLTLNRGQEDVQNVTLKGSAEPIVPTLLRPRPKPGQIEFRAGLTTVSADFWDRWAKENKNFGPLKKGLIFVHKEHRSAIAMAEEREKEKTGLERITPPKKTSKPGQIGTMEA